MNPEKQLLKTIIRFIIESRQKGFSDFQIRRAFHDKNYPDNQVEKAFLSLQPKFKIKNQVCVFLSNEILSVLEKRAKKNMMALNEQIEDILRRSSIRKTSATTQEKLDDMLIACFSRKKTGKK